MSMWALWLVWLCLDQSTASVLRRNGYPLRLPLQTIPIPPLLPRETNVTVWRPVDDASLARNAYVLTTTQPWSVVVPDPDIESPLQRTSVQAARHDCVHATNGGPFQRDGTPVGAIVSNGRIVADTFDSVGFGMGRSSGATESWFWVVGIVDSVAHAHTLGLEQFVTGFDWLVYKGINVANNMTGVEQAPRTAIGVTHDGRLILVVTDGCERCWDGRGVRVTELAALLIRQGAEYAINLDGGSSSVLIGPNHGVQSRPTCLDVLPIVCERPVASVVCIGAVDVRHAQLQH